MKVQRICPVMMCLFGGSVKFLPYTEIQLNSVYVLLYIIKE